MFTTSKRFLVAALAVTAAAAPSTASAMRIADLQGAPIASAQSSAGGAQQVAMRAQQVGAGAHQAQVSQPSSSPFAWGDAGIGAAVATVALMGAGSILLGGRRRRGHTARTS
jgi:hypothetical protein